MKQKNRIKSTGEVFTPEPLVDEILDQLPPLSIASTKTYCDPSCGDGAFLRRLKARLLKQKISCSHILYNQLYGVELMPDNCMDCIFNLLATTQSTPESIYKKRFDLDKNPIEEYSSLDDKDRLLFTAYRVEKTDIYVTKIRDINQINLSPNIIGIEKKLVEDEIKSGVGWFNFKINGDEWKTYPNIVCCNSLEYDFTFGRPKDFSL